MAMTSSSQVARLLALVPYLQAHPDADLEQTAQVFHVPARQLVADLKVLWFCGLPGGMPGDLIEVDMDALAEGRIRLDNADFLSRPLRLSVEEAMSLIVALGAIQDMAGSDLAPAVSSARAKLEAVFGANDRIGVSLQAGEETVRAALAGALGAGQTVRLTYHGASRGSTTHPVVEPASLATRDGYGYLTAWSRDRNDWRTYRLDRVSEVTLMSDPVGDHGEPPALGSGWLDERPEAARVVVDVTPAGRWIVEYHPTVAVEEQDDGITRVELLVADPAWLRRLLLRLGPAVVRVDPPQAARSAIEAAREALDGQGRGGDVEDA